MPKDEVNTKLNRKKKSFLYITGFPSITIIFIMLVFIGVLNAISSYYYISKERDNIQKIAQLINPFLEDLDQLNDLIIESKMYTTNWVHVPNSIEDKAKLDSIQRIKYPLLKAGITEKSKILKESFKNYSNANNIQLIFTDLDELIEVQKAVMQTLASFDDYENPGKKFMAEDIIESQLFPQTQEALSKLNVLTIEIRRNSDELKQSILQDSERRAKILIFFSVSLVLSIIAAIYFMSVKIRKPSIEMKDVIDSLSRGELSDSYIEESNNIIGEMAFSLNKLTENFKKTYQFAKEIEDGNLIVPFEKLSDKDLLGEALISMRDSLRSYSLEMETRIKERAEEVIQKGKDIEVQKIFYESVLSSIPLDIFIYDDDRRYIYINDVAINDDKKRNYLLGKTDIDYCELEQIDQEFAQRSAQCYDSARTTKSTAEFEDRTIDDKQNVVWKIWRFTPVFAGDVFRYMISYGMDITGMKNQEMQIIASLEEKESLLGEIHHRVKNNLTLVLGLIEMQRDFQTDNLLKNQFNEIKNRIYTMALIHDKMYKSNSFANIELSEYLRDLLTSVSRFYGKGKAVNLKFDMQKVFVKGKDAIPIGLLMNEIVTNSFKYAFNSNSTKGNLQEFIQVSLHKTTDVDNEFVISVKDNGPGLPDNFDFSKTKSLGFKLIHIFVKQLKGELNYFNDNGLTFVIKFKL
ncbi:MAG: histidine kinase dimerization/phosphoacceptor domain -containing protein [Bacteroidota bacterium]